MYLYKRSKYKNVNFDLCDHWVIYDPLRSEKTVIAVDRIKTVLSCSHIDKFSGNFRKIYRASPYGRRRVKSLTRSHIIISSCISLILSTFLLAKLLFLSKIRTENLNTVIRNTIGPLKRNNSYSSYQIATLLLFLIILANISLLNPGPQRFKGLNCFFQNVQGFVTLNSIHKQDSDLNITKLIEFQTHIFENSPDIILLNETWLKPTISDIEIIQKLP